jgi:uncharacterized damage-inducible protein DinB
MDIAIIRTLYDYTYWANRKLWDCVEALTEEQFIRAADHSIGSVKDQVVHMMSAEYIWFSRLRGVSPDSMLTPEHFPDRAAIRARWDRVESDVRAYLAALTDDSARDVLRYQRTDGTPLETPVWVILYQVVNHATDHRAQIMALIHSMGGPTFAQDFMFFMRERR